MFAALIFGLRWPAGSEEVLFNDRKLGRFNPACLSVSIQRVLVKIGISTNHTCPMRRGALTSRDDSAEPEWPEGWEPFLYKCKNCPETIKVNFPKDLRNTESGVNDIKGYPIACMRRIRQYIVQDTWKAVLALQRKYVVCPDEFQIEL